MLSDKLKSPNIKLYLLLIILLILFLVFLVMYTKNYFSYYKKLYDYRQDLLTILTDTEVQKPVFNPGDPAQGNPRANIVIFEYGDFSCPSCASLQPVLQEIKDFYGSNNILLIWKDLPITSTDINLTAHQAAHCAADQNSFFAYKEQLYQNQNNFSKELFLELAKKLNLDQKQFQECLDNQKYKDTVENNFREALQLGLDSTPTLFINNQEVVSGFNFQNLRKIIETTK